MDKLILKKFQSDNDYRQSFTEGINIFILLIIFIIYYNYYYYLLLKGIRRCIGQGYQFPAEIMDLIQDSPEYQDPDHCTVCYGTDKSGISLLCDNCDLKETHLQCLRVPLLIVPSGNWYCDDCCNLLKIPVGDIHYTEDQNPTSSNEEIEIGTDTKTKVKAGRPKTMGSSINGNGNGIVNQLKKVSKSSKVGGKSSKNDSESFLKNDENLNDFLQDIQSKQNIKDDDEIIEDDKCFVCGEGGKLILCDFPSCPRVYHHVCVLKTVPSVPYEEMGSNSSSLGNEFGLATNDMNDAWFCPSHKCICCDVLDETACPIRSLTLPISLKCSIATQDSSNFQLRKKIPQKSLESCNSCPFSICNDCDKDLAGRRSTLSSKRINGIKISTCRLCISTKPILKLAKILEKALVKMLKSRLSLPFLHPFLPGIVDDDNNNFNSSNNNNYGLDKLESKKRNISSISTSSNNQSSNNPRDLVDVMEGVRNLKYKSSEEFLNDIQYLRTILVQAIDSQKHSDESKVDVEKNESPLLLSFDTLFNETKLYIEKSLRNAHLEPHDLDDDPNRNVKQKLEDDDIASSATEHSVTQIENHLLRFWRAECEKNIFSGINDRNYDSHYRVMGQTLSSWEAFVSEGNMPDTFYDGYEDSKSGNFFKERQYESEVGARMLARGWIDMYGVSQTDYINDIEAAGLMLGMSNNNRRETVTLLEDNYTNESLEWSKMRRITDEDGNYDQSEITNLANDETLIMLDRLKDLSTKALHLENKIRKNYMENMRNVLNIDDTQQLRLGEMSILKELKLSNDNLRWRLKQKQRVLMSSNMIINNLKEALNKAELNFDKCNQELIMIKEQKQEVDLKYEKCYHELQMIKEKN